MTDVGAAGAVLPGAAKAGIFQGDSQSGNGQPSGGGGGGGGGSSSRIAGKEEGEEEEKRPFVRPQTSSKLSMPQDGELLQDGTVRINTWSTPRSLSTALMYSFAQRPDTVVYDEPLCAHFLRTHKEEQKWRQGYLDEVFKQQDSDGDRWIREVALGPSPKPVVYMKHIANMIRNLDLHFLPKCRNVIQIRTPIQVLPSWNVHIDPSMNEIGMLDLLNVYSHIRSCGQSSSEVSLVFSTVASVSFLAPWRMVEAGCLAGLAHEAAAYPPTGSNPTAAIALYGPWMITKFIPIRPREGGRRCGYSKQQK